MDCAICYEDAFGMHYRPEIEGLRALAVLAVMIAHTGIDWLAGGFVGVDVFFVISGFLITGIILRDLEGGTFRFGSFYARRARRIFPALFVMLAITSATAWALMSPSEIKDFSASVFFSVLFLSNGYFADFIDYFAPSSHEIPLLHTWSLAIEEQFYLLFPLLAFLVWRRFGTKGLLIVVIVMLLLSFSLAEWGWRNKPRVNYFFSPSRFWEILLGAVAAIFVARRRVVSSTPLALLGICAVCASMFLYDETTPFPSAFSLLPTLGTVLLLLFCGGTGTVARLLSLKPLRFLGLISFSAYLWHQPVFAFSRLQGADPAQPFAALTLIAAVLAISAISWRYVEQPFRHGTSVSMPPAKWQAPFLGVIAVALSGVAVLGYATSLPMLRHPAQDRPILEMTRLAASEYQRDIGKPFSRRLFEEGNTFPKTAFIGDSYARDFLNVLNEAGVLAQLDASLWTISRNCAPFFLHSEEEEELRAIWDTQECRDYDRYRSPEMMQAIAAADFVVLASRWVEWHVPHLQRTVDNLRAVTDAQIVIIGTKDFGQVSLRRLLRLPPAERISFRATLDRDLVATNEIMRAMAQVPYIDLIDAICDEGGLCPQVAHDGRLISQDGTHLTPSGARLVAEALGGREELSALFAKPSP
jgi:peptidoglycan/LPS O-acetylase OafA/YrhL